MKIVLATTARTRGGVWRHVEDLGSGLVDRGHDVVIGLLPDATALREAAGQAGLETEEFWATARLSDWIWHGHLHDTFDRTFLWAALFRRFRGPTVLTEHLPRTNASDARLQPGARHPLAAPAKTAFKRLEYGLVQRVIAVSRSSQAFIAERYGSRPDRLVAVFNGIDHASACGAPATPGLPLRVLCIGSVIYQKGFDLLLDAAEIVPDPGWRATVLGEGPARSALGDRAADGGVVEFAGWSLDVAADLAAAHVVCMPSRWESAPYAALEAMNAGRPLVAFAVDGVTEIIEDGVSGLLVPPGDVRALASALERLAGDESLRLALGRAAYERAGEFTRLRMVDETVAVYRDLARPPSRPPSGEMESGS